MQTVQDTNTNSYNPTNKTLTIRSNTPISVDNEVERLDIFDNVELKNIKFNNNINTILLNNHILENYQYLPMPLTNLYITPSLIEECYKNQSYLSSNNKSSVIKNRIKYFSEFQDIHEHSPWYYNSSNLDFEELASTIMANIFDKFQINPESITNIYF